MTYTLLVFWAYVRAGALSFTPRFFFWHMGEMDLADGTTRVGLFDNTASKAVKFYEVAKIERRRL